MDLDRRLERLCDRITLVRGAGRPRCGELCVMSLVALLAGERHTDQPASASPLIGNIAIPLNDAMPPDERQRLKPFAARILGSNDGRDRARAEVLRRTLAEEILPRIRRDLGAGRVPGGRRAPLGFLFANAVGRDLEARAALLLARLELLLARPEHGIPPGPEGAIGSAAGELLALCMRAATTRERRAWYREEAIGLLDRLCGVGRETRGPAVREDGIARAEERLGDGGTWLGGIRRSLLRSAWQVRRLETGRTDAAPEASRPSAVRPGPPVDGGTAHRGAVGHDVPYERARDRRDQIRHRPVEAALEREGP